MQLELLAEGSIDKRRGYHLLPRYKKAIPIGLTSLSTIDLYLAERGDYNTSLGDIKQVMETRENLIARGYSFLNLLVNCGSSYDDWHRKTYPVKVKAKPEPEYIYDI